MFFLVNFAVFFLFLDEKTVFVCRISLPLSSGPLTIQRFLNRTKMARFLNEGIFIFFLMHSFVGGRQTRSLRCLQRHFFVLRWLMHAAVKLARAWLKVAGEVDGFAM